MGGTHRAKILPASREGRLGLQIIAGVRRKAPIGRREGDEQGAEFSWGAGGGSKREGVFTAGCQFRNPSQLTSAPLNPIRASGKGFSLLPRPRASAARAPPPRGAPHSPSPEPLARALRAALLRGTLFVSSSSLFVGLNTSLVKAPHSGGSSASPAGRLQRAAPTPPAAPHAASAPTPPSWHPACVRSPEEANRDFIDAPIPVV